MGGIKSLEMVRKKQLRNTVLTVKMCEVDQNDDVRSTHACNFDRQRYIDRDATPNLITKCPY